MIHRLAVVLFLLVALMEAAPLSAALPPPYYQVSLNGGSTTNLFADSTGVHDSFGGLNLNLEQDLSPALTVWYLGQGNGYAATGGLGSLSHRGGVDFDTNFGNAGELWASADLNLLRFGSTYDLYNRLGGGLTGGLYYTADPALRLRATASSRLTTFPNGDTLGVNYSEQSASAGINASLPLPASLDVEPGLQWRHYGDLAVPANTSFLWLALRATTPLAVNTGLVGRLLLREQLAVSGDEIRALARGGLDVGDMLWSGWQGSVTLNHRAGPWSLGISAEAGRSAYLATVIYTDPADRVDQLKRFSITLGRSLLLPPGKPLITFGASLEYSNNSSNIGYYAFHGMAGGVTVSISAR